MMWLAGRPLSAKQLLMGDNVSAPVAADALYTALDDLMARVGALSAERRCAQSCPEMKYDINLASHV